jgi:hypothetical protein
MVPEHLAGATLAQPTSHVRTTGLEPPIAVCLCARGRRGRRGQLPRSTRKGSKLPPSRRAAEPTLATPPTPADHAAGGNGASSSGNGTASLSRK